MLLQMTPPWFRWTKFSEDFEFCLGATAYRLRLWMDTGLVCGHLPEPTAIGAQDFYTIRDDSERLHYDLYPEKWRLQQTGAWIKPAA